MIALATYITMTVVCKTSDSLPSGVVLVSEDVGKSKDGFHYRHILSNNTPPVKRVLADGPQSHCRVS